MKSLLMLVMCCAATIASADGLIVKSGAVYSGTISGASRDSISILCEAGTVTVYKPEVGSIIFTNSDVIILDRDTTLICKIAGKRNDDVIVTTASGIRAVANNRIQEARYNTGPEIQVSDLPETGRQFTNVATRRVWTGDRLANIYVRARLAVHSASLSQWKDQFTFSGDEGSPGTGPMFGGEIGYALQRWVQLGAGYEYFLSSEVQINAAAPTFTDRVTSGFLYGNLRVGEFLPSVPNLFLYGFFSAGSLSATETIRFSDGGTFEASGRTTAYRFGGGVEFYVAGNFSTSTEIGYLVGNVKEVQMYGETLPGYSLDCSGVNLLLALSYHVPLP